MTQTPGSEALERIATAIGQALLGYTLNMVFGSAVADDFSDGQSEFIRELDGVLAGPVAEQYEQVRLHEMLRFSLTDTSKFGQPLANKMRLEFGGAFPDSSDADSPDRLIRDLARDTFPAFLLPPGESIGFLGPRESPHVAGSIFRHPGNKAFQDAIISDPHFSAVFGEDNPHVGRHVTLYRSTLRGGTVQLSMLASIILGNAWKGGLGHPSSVEEFCDRAQLQLHFMRSALAGESVTVKAYQAFAGVRLPSGVVWNADEGIVVREVTERDRERAPESLKRQLAGTDSAGETTVINYDGDVVVECKYPYRVKVASESIEDARPDFDDLSSSLVSGIANRLRLSLLIAVQRDQKVQLVPSWQFYEDPFDAGYFLSWNDSTQAVGLTPTQLTEPEVEAWREWFELLGNPHAEHIDLALSRVIRAVSERREPSDVLIDSVIAWENLFGSKDGEPTLRVTASLALLLEGNPSARRKLRTKLGKIYALRSDVVHGTSALKEQAQFAACYEALDIAIEALRVLLRDRKDVLAQRTGTERSLHLIVGPA
ncbi:hypothetical protein [Streptomyces sp. NPDC047024]|uniref:hypothetical protein n=1 Tax=Streptomyces sp. NPDC047024 TaxID=3155476 RepID=UPI0033E7B190